MSIKMSERMQKQYYDQSVYPPVMSQPGPGYPPPGAPVYTQPTPYSLPGDAGFPPNNAPAGVYPPAGFPSQGQQRGYPEGYIGGGIVPGGHTPPGLEYLLTIDQLLVKQTVELFEAFTGYETNNKYKVLNSLGQKIFMAKEDTDCCTRQCCGPLRPFDMTICDLGGNEVIHIHRPLACQSCCFPCCLQTLEIQSPPGTVIGTVEQDWSLIYPRFTVKDESGEAVLKIEGPCWTCSCFGDVEFKVLSATDKDKQVGMISKQWTGLAKEMFTDADNFGISFPLDLSVKMKATLLGAVFLIDFMYFEKSNNNNNNNNN